MCALFYFVVLLFSHALLPFNRFTAHSFLKGLCGSTYQSPGLCGNAHPVMPRLAQRGRRSALNERVRTLQSALDLLESLRQHDLNALRAALRALRWFASELHYINREREQRTDLDLASCQKAVDNNLKLVAKISSPCSCCDLLVWQMLFVSFANVAILCHPLRS